MPEWPAKIFRACFPMPSFESADAYRVRIRQDPAYNERFAALEAATRWAKVEQQQHFCNFAQQYVDEQRDLTSSIIGRAQGLLIAQTFLGALLALVTALMGHSELFDGWTTYLLFALLAYTIVQLLLLTWNALRATAGLNYRSPGVSPLVEGTPEREELLLRRMGLEFIQSYWEANIANTWRVNHLGLAQNCLRNIVFALAGLVLALIVVIYSNAGSKNHIYDNFRSIPCNMLPGICFTRLYDLEVDVHIKRPPLT
jgi:hypothetical protein